MSDTSTRKREITREDLIPLDEYAKTRKERRKALTEMKRSRRVELGPYVTFYFENYETMWSQVQEMLYIEKGGEEQIADELSAYNPLIPQGSELVATMMFEIGDEKRRRELLARLGGVEDRIYLVLDDERIRAVPEDDVERSTPGGKTSSVHFLHFQFTAEQIARFRDSGVRAKLEIDHPEYDHSAAIPQSVREVLAEDFD
jgi:hypothetical protein